MNQLKSQILGVLLAVLTGIGTIGYEKIVKNFSYATIVFGFFIEILLLIVYSIFFMNNAVQTDYHKFIQEPKYIFWFLLWIGTAGTSILWYKITESQGAMIASLYEIKFIVVMAVMYIMFGENRFTWNTLIGIILTLSAIYFISK